MLGNTEGRWKGGGVTEEEMVGWHHRLNGHEFEQTLGDSDGQGGLGMLLSMGLESQDMTATEQQQTSCPQTDRNRQQYL